MSKKDYNQQTADLSKALKDLKSEIAKVIEPIFKPIIVMLACERHIRQLECVLPPSNRHLTDMAIRISRGLPYRVRGAFLYGINHRVMGGESIISAMSSELEDTLYRLEGDQNEENRKLL